MDEQIAGFGQSLVVIGEGEAALGAALEAARCGLPAVLLMPDAEPNRSRDSRFRGRGAVGENVDAQTRLRRELGEVADRVRVHRGIRVVGIWPGGELIWTGARGTGVCRIEQAVLASEPAPRSMMFPGWALAGVINSAELNALPLAAGRRAMVSGTGPRLLVAARWLVEQNVHVIGVLEAGSAAWLETTLADAPLLETALSARQFLRDAGVPFDVNHAVFRADGPPGLKSATFGPIDPDDWRPLRERERTAEVDLLITDFGDTARGELAVLGGCRQRFDLLSGGWVTDADPTRQTSTAGLLSAGESGGVAHALVAEAEGRIAGITAAERAGTIGTHDASARRAVWLDRHATLAKSRAVIEEGSRIRPGLLELVEADTVICPCEGTTLGSVRQAIAVGARGMSALKLMTRLGMGTCQGRTCSAWAEAYLARVTKQSAEAVGRVNPRPPAVPITLGELARAESAIPDGAERVEDTWGEDPS